MKEEVMLLLKKAEEVKSCGDYYGEDSEEYKELVKIFEKIILRASTKRNELPKYKHFKGVEYRVIGIAIVFAERKIIDLRKDKSYRKIGIAKDSETLEEYLIEELIIEGIPYRFIFSNNFTEKTELIFYKSTDNYQLWLRSFDEFVEIHKSGVKRFQMISKK